MRVKLKVYAFFTSHCHGVCDMELVEISRNRGKGADKPVLKQCD